MAAECGGAPSGPKGSPLLPPGLCTHPRESAWSRNVWVSIIPPYSRALLPLPLKEIKCLLLPHPATVRSFTLNLRLREKLPTGRQGK